MRKLIAIATTLLTALVLAALTVPMFVGASSHRDAPMILEDPTADNTDVYAWVAPQNPDAVTILANYIPLEEPGDGPNYYRFSDAVLYEIKIDTDGDAREDLTYQFRFKTSNATGGTFLYNLGKVIGPEKPSDPTSPYRGLNVMQAVAVTEVDGGKHKVLLKDARVAPAHVGPKSTGTKQEYEGLAAMAIHAINGGYRVFAGPRAEGFYVDLMGAFDLINIRNPGVNTTSGYNVHTIAIEVPKSRIQAAGDTDGRIGIWATASRPGTTVLRSDGTANTSGTWVQVSRLGNPLVNEVLLPLRLKDQYNARRPKDDDGEIANNIVNPMQNQGAGALVPVLNSLTNCTPVNGRDDLQLALLTGIPEGALPGFSGNMDTQQKTPVRADMLRLNYNINPSAMPHRLGLLGGDPAGWPNGRRVGDDVTDIALKAAGGAVLHVLGAIKCTVSLELGDNVNGPDVPYLSTFPYLATPHQGYSHGHAHQ
jgi:hypothetical protein